ncbi:replication initiator protein A [Paenibacillus brasilensis]|uniref:REP element-mobilizing transposase RayT n=1 Tax=Paenibacillus brasilensis TaxID=128574 RepID=A0ABU0L6C5_9BACL|nr:replication initiator protein A [Paenibacillus brasilensis]MDQ0496853.1 REP element-mobilizing transposase RayT [Paenibacillus brasilensis]
MSESDQQVESQLDAVAKEFLKKTQRLADPLKAATIYQETADALSAELIQSVPVKSLFMYANQSIESLKTRLDKDNDTANHALIKAKIEILERALRVKSVEYLREVVPINTNIAQHALFSANPKNVSSQMMTTVHGVRSVHIKNNTGEVLTTYEARVMGAIQSLWFKKNVDGKPYVELKYADILCELGLTDGSANYKRIQEALMRLMNIEVTLTQYQRSKDAEYEEIAFTRLIDQIVFRRKVGTTNHYQYKFQIRLPEWLVEANREGNLFDISLILMNDLKSYLAQGLYWLVSSYADEPVVTLELSTLAGHFHFLDNGEPIMPVYKIIERIKNACVELQAVGFIEHFEFTGKKQGLVERYLTVTKNPIFLNTVARSREFLPEQIELSIDPY